MRINFEDAVERYGKIDLATKTWPDAKLWLADLILPPELHFPNWINSFTNKPVEHFYLNKDMGAAVIAALYHVKERDLSDELKTFDGLYNIRAVRGSTVGLSTHSYGLAIDLNARENPLGGPVRFSRGFVECFLDAGFSWGGNFHRVDGMHFSWAWE